jgi:hypothetical protein
MRQTGELRRRPPRAATAEQVAVARAAVAVARDTSCLPLSRGDGGLQWRRPLLPRPFPPSLSSLSWAPQRPLPRGRTHATDTGCGELLDGSMPFPVRRCSDFYCKSLLQGAIQYAGADSLRPCVECLPSRRGEVLIMQGLGLTTVLSTPSTFRKKAYLRTSLRQTPLVLMLQRWLSGTE